MTLQIPEQSPAPDTELLLTIEEAAKRLKIGRTNMVRLISSGAIKSVTIGRLRRVPPECLAEYVSTLMATGRAQG